MNRIAKLAYRLQDEIMIALMLGAILGFLMWLDEERDAAFRRLINENFDEKERTDD